MALSSTKTVLITRPSYDLVTNYLFYWSKNLLEEASKKGAKVLDLPEQRANAKELSSVLQKMTPELCVINGHGSDNTIYGQDNKPMLNASNNHLLKNAVVYARSCSTGAKLGAMCIAKGTQAYIGYTQPFWLCYDIEKTHHPLEDNIANYVMMPSNQVVVSLLKGNTAIESSKRSKAYSRTMMKELMSSNAPDGASNILSCVWINMKNQVCLGNPEAVI
jgi:hypothetical protein